MLGLPSLPRKLPSRNWLIFWAITGSFTAAIVYDKREKNRATAKWRRVVAPLATEPINTASQLPRKLTIYLESPPGDGLRVAQDHFLEYAKPVLAASGLDWEFVQGRQQGDVRAAVAENIRRTRRAAERPNEEREKTNEDIIDDTRAKLNLPEYEGVKGDIIVGRHTWKEYVRGLHEGWLGSLDAPPPPVVENAAADAAAADAAAAVAADTLTSTLDSPAAIDIDTIDAEAQAKKQKEEEEAKKKEEEKKSARPPQPPPYNSVTDYPTAYLPPQAPAEFSPSITIPFPFRLGFSHTFVRLGRFLNRRKLADEIGRDMAAACFASSRDYREADGQYEQQLILKQEEKDWVKSVWKTDEEEAAERKKNNEEEPAVKKERIWISEMVTDARIMDRMRRFEVTEEVEARARQILVPEEEIEGWIKGSLRSLVRWGMGSFQEKNKMPEVGNLDDD